MRAVLHMCGPKGDALWQENSRILELLKLDNRYVINAMLNAHQRVPNTVIEMGLEYKPATGREKHSDEIHYYGLREMMFRGTFSCGDAAAFEAAIMEEKFRIDTTVLAAPQGATDHHAVYVTSDMVVDPTENWLRYWERQAGISSKTTLNHPMDGRRQVPAVKLCRIDAEGEVVCENVRDKQVCSVGPDGTWSCPIDNPINGRRADVRKRQHAGGRSWALVGEGYAPVPVHGRRSR